jgi:hypothetical protein
VIELVNDKVTDLKQYLVNQIEGPGARPAWGRALPGEGTRPQIDSGRPQEQEERKEMWS